MPRSRSKSPSRSASRPRRRRSRSRERKKRRDRSPDRAHDRVQSRDKSHDQSRDKSHDQSRDKSRDQSRDRSRERRRSRSPLDRKADREKNWDEEREKRKRELRDESFMMVATTEIPNEHLEGKTPEEIEMMRVMGFAGFTTTKGKKSDRAPLLLGRVEGTAGALALVRIMYEPREEERLTLGTDRDEEAGWGGGNEVECWNVTNLGFSFWGKGGGRVFLRRATGGEGAKGLVFG
eukprot:maker-scaffold308_size214241-snap-gene-1.48 protein:Tk09071 transcript:maker-scaffold308_size214241-snap-gene-1.48-mRNA-1 annotation:"u4 small nuclear ribonucleoprotein 27 kda protein"